MVERNFKVLSYHAQLLKILMLIVTPFTVTELTLRQSIQNPSSVCSSFVDLLTEILRITMGGCCVH